MTTVGSVLRKALRVASFWGRCWLALAGSALTLALLLVAGVYGSWPLRSTDEADAPNKLTVAELPSLPRASLAVKEMPLTRPFIGIAMSGGGSRSANFALAVSRQLDALGLLSQSEALSGVSGGSMTAAYLALNLKEPPTPKFWSNAYTALGQRFEDALRTKAFQPDVFIKTLTTSFSRGDVWAAVLDDKLFHGSTFGSLSGSVDSQSRANTYRPTLLVNATSISDPFITDERGLSIEPRMANGYYMAPFTFTSERFRSMHSDLAAFNLSYAVASSSAFPGAINPISLVVADRGYIQAPVPRGAPPGAPARFNFAKRYMHLADGGLSDNLGIDALRKLFEVRSGFQRDANNEYHSRPCLIVAIDAANQPFDEPRNRALSRDSRNHWWSALVDATVIEGYDSYLIRRRLDQLDELGLDPAGIEYGDLLRTRPTSIAEVKVRSRFYRYRNAGFEVGNQTVFSRSIRARTVQGRKPIVDIPDYTCTIWHIALEDLAVRQNLDEQHRVVASIAPAVLSLATSLNLRTEQSPDCSEQHLQSFLDAAAIALVHGKRTRMAVCSWLMDAGLSTSGCDAAPPTIPTLDTSCVRPPNKRWLEIRNEQHEWARIAAGIAR